MEELVTTKKHFSKLGWCYAAATVIIILTQELVAILVKKLQPQWLEDVNISMILGVIPLYLVGFPLLILMLKKSVPSAKIEKRKMSPGQYAVSAIICIGLAYAANIFGNIVTFIIGNVRGRMVQNEILNVVDSLHPGVVLIYMVICAPILEEFFFRKLIVDRTVRYGQGVAVVVSGLMFGLFHGNLNQFVYAALIGGCFAYLYVKTGNLKIAISLHMLFNFIGGFLSSLLMRLINLDELMLAQLSSGPVLMNYMKNHILGLVLYMLFLLFVFCVLVAGVVLFIVFLAKKKFVLNKGEVVIPKGKRFKVIFINPGMLVFTAIWMVRIVMQLLV